MKNIILRKTMTIMLSLIMFAQLIGCGGRKAVDNYPGMIPGDESEADTASEGSIEETKYSDGRVYYMARNQRGDKIYRIDAEIIGNPLDTYPVYDIKFWNMSQQDLYNISAFMVGARSANYLLPLDIADEEYLTNRLLLLTERRDKRLEKGKEVSHAITSEMEDIQEILAKGDFGNRYTLPTPTVPQFIDLHDYYEAEYGADVDLQFSFAENEDPNGNVIRFDVFKYHGNTTLKLYYEDYNYDDSNNYYLGAEESILPVSFDKIDGNACEEMARGLLDAIGLSSMECTKRYPACDYGAFADIAGKHAHEKPAYCCFFSEKVNDRTRPCNSATDFYSNNMTSTRPILSASTITTIFAHGEGEYNYGDYSVEAGSAGTYDSFCVCIGADNSPVEVLATNILDDIQIKTEKAKLLPFEDADACAQKYLAYAVAHDEEGYERTIDRIELGMCRAIGDTGNMFMVPAWYYFLKTTGDSPLPEPVMAVNAIDGSIIDVQAGGVTKTF